MRAIEIPHNGGPLTLVERLLPEPRRGEVRVRVEACGICHSDGMAVEGQFPGVTYPLIPGHEIAGHIDAPGEGVKPMIETMPLDKAPEAYERMMKNEARFRMVLTMAA